jgi:hypothetical protein
VAFAETVLHEEVPKDGRYEIPADQLDRYVLRFAGPPLRLAKMTGPSLNILGGNGELSGTADYTLPREWSRAVFFHPEKVDGFIYMSRLSNDGAAVVLFERGHLHPLDLLMSADVKLVEHVDFDAVLAEFNVKIIV